MPLPGRPNHRGIPTSVLHHIHPLDDDNCDTEPPGHFDPHTSSHALLPSPWIQNHSRPESLTLPPAQDSCGLADFLSASRLPPLFSWPEAPPLDYNYQRGRSPGEAKPADLANYHHNRPLSQNSAAPAYSGAQAQRIEPCMSSASEDFDDLDEDILDYHPHLPSLSPLEQSARHSRVAPPVPSDDLYEFDEDLFVDQALPYQSSGPAENSGTNNPNTFRSLSPDPFALHSDLNNEDYDAIFGLHERASPPPQPATRRQSYSATGFIDLSSLQSNMPSKKRKAGPSEARPAKSAKLTKPIPAPEKQEDEPKVEMIDLVDMSDDEDVSTFLAKKQAVKEKEDMIEAANKPFRLAEFNCIICMDNPTDLVVTHCGHLFCSECLHQALHAGNGRKSCPVCRQPIAIHKGPGPRSKSSKDKGCFALAIKAMTKKKQGKQAVR